MNRRKVEALSDFLKGEMKRKHITYEVMAGDLRISRQTLSRYLEKGSIPSDLLMEMFKVLKTEKETIGELMR